MEQYTAYEGELLPQTPTGFGYEIFYAPDGGENLGDPDNIEDSRPVGWYLVVTNETTDGDTTWFGTPWGPYPSSDAAYDMWIRCNPNKEG
jgi:hypothetical protein